MNTPQLKKNPAINKHKEDKINRKNRKMKSDNLRIIKINQGIKNKRKEDFVSLRPIIHVHV